MRPSAGAFGCSLGPKRRIEDLAGKRHSKFRPPALAAFLILRRESRFSRLETLLPTARSGAGPCHWYSFGVGLPVVVQSVGAKERTACSLPVSAAAGLVDRLVVARHLTVARGHEGCPQNPDRHAEGDVWTHVHMVAEAMVALSEWAHITRRRPSHPVRRGLAPRCRQARVNRFRGPRLRSQHSWRGNCPHPQHPLEARCTACRAANRSVPLFATLVPFFLADSENPTRLAIEVSQTARCDLLAIMAEADIRGRICPNPEKLAPPERSVPRQGHGIGVSPGRLSSQPITRFLFFRDDALWDSPVENGFRSDVRC